MIEVPGYEVLGELGRGGQGYVHRVRHAATGVERALKVLDGPLDPESNYLFGEGGAGTFSDGKLTSRGTGADVRHGCTLGNLQGIEHCLGLFLIHACLAEQPVNAFPRHDVRDPPPHIKAGRIALGSGF